MLYPFPLPPSRKVRPVQTLIKKVVNGCNCCQSSASLSCSRCHAVMYCSEECQRSAWRAHKEICCKIRDLAKEATDAEKFLAEQHGGLANFFDTTLVRNGTFTSFFVPYYTDKSIEECKAIWTPEQQFIGFRQRLIEAYVECAEKTMSSLAFRLAAEKKLDQLCLTYQKEHVLYAGRMRSCCGWMVAGGMDQEALNLLNYLTSRRNTGV